MDSYAFTTIRMDAVHIYIYIFMWAMHAMVCEWFLDLCAFCWPMSLLLLLLGSFHLLVAWCWCHSRFYLPISCICPTHNTDAHTHIFTIRTNDRCSLTFDSRLVYFYFLCFFFSDRLAFVIGNPLFSCRFESFSSHRSHASVWYAFIHGSHFRAHNNNIKNINYNNNNNNKINNDIFIIIESRPANIVNSG